VSTIGYIQRKGEGRSILCLEGKILPVFQRKGRKKNRGVQSRGKKKGEEKKTFLEDVGGRRKMVRKTGAFHGAAARGKSLTPRIPVEEIRHRSRKRVGGNPTGDTQRKKKRILNRAVGEGGLIG